MTGDRYRLDAHGDRVEVFGQDITPERYDVRDADSGEKLGEVVAWNPGHAGEKIADGDWSRDDD